MAKVETEALPFEIIGVGLGHVHRELDELWREFTLSLSFEKEGLVGLTGKLALLRAGVQARNAIVVSTGTLHVRNEIGNSQAGNDILRSDELSKDKIKEMLTSGTAV